VQVLESVLTCPQCGHAKAEVMPTDACQFFYTCGGCGTLLRPKAGDCCVFCSYGSRPCPPKQAAADGAGSVFVTFLRLGCTSFGGPIAHIGYFRHEFVERRRWFDDKGYSDLVALCNFLPGPASSQVGIAVGISRAGLAGGLAAWLGFTLPSALLLILFAYGFVAAGLDPSAGWLHGLKLAAVAVVAQAVWNMGRSLCPDPPRASLAMLAALLVLAAPGTAGQLAAIVAGALAGWRWFEPAKLGDSGERRYPIGRGTAIAAWVIFVGLLVLLPLLRQINASSALALFDSFYRTGSLVFGGGHVVLPLLRNEVVQPGWVNDDVFLAGYGAAQAVPGPLFTFAAYLGSTMTRPPSGVGGGLLALVAIFLPSFLLVVGALPFWEALRRKVSMQKALSGINAAVVGLLLAALYDPVWTSSVRTRIDFAIALLAFALLAFWRVSPLVVVAIAAAAGGLAAA
jgi:chromate transporter